MLQTKDFFRKKKPFLVGRLAFVHRRSHVCMADSPPFYAFSVTVSQNIIPNAGDFLARFYPTTKIRLISRAAGESSAVCSPSNRCGCGNGTPRSMGFLCNIFPGKSIAKKSLQVLPSNIFLHTLLTIEFHR